MRKFYRVVRKHLQPFFVQTPNESQFRVLASKFERLHGITYNVRATSESYVYVLASEIVGKDFYYMKSFNSTIL